MRKLQLILACILLFWIGLFAQGKVNPNYHYVKSYTRSDGTVVSGHYRTNPNSTNRDNYSTLGNWNIHTGEPGWITPDNKPLPSYSTTSYTSTGYTPSVDYFSNWNTSSNSTSRTSQILADLSGVNSSSNTNRTYNSSSSNYSTYSYDLSEGGRVINYTDGRDVFNVAAPTKITYKKGLTYYSYDVYLNAIKETVGSAEGQLLLNGPYRFYDENSKLRIVENYKKGLKHGSAGNYNEAGQLIANYEYTEGRLTYQKFTSETGVTFEVFGEMDKPGTQVMMYRDSELFRKVEIVGGGRQKRTEYDPATQKAFAEYGLLDGELDGSLRRYQSDGKTLEEESNYRNGERNGEARFYHLNSKLREKSCFKEGIADGPFELYNESGVLVRKGRMSNGELHGEIQNFYEDGTLKSKETYVAGKLSGAFTLYQKGKPMVIGDFRNGQQHGRWNYYWQDSSKYYLAQWLTFENGVENGPFREIRQDSVLVGTYKNGQIEGEFRIYKPMILWLLGIPPKELDESEIACTGRYFNGKKNGHWKFYSRTGILLSEGNYSDDLEHGEWRFYLEKYADFEGKDVEYAGKLFLIENYVNGVKNGRFERLAYLDQIPVMCDTSIGTVNPLDTCFQLRYKKVREVTYYKNGELHGPMEWSDSDGNITFKGEYRSGRKFGRWTETYADPEDASQVYRFEADYSNGQIQGAFQKFDARTNALLTDGYYNADQPVGTWKHYFPDGKKVHRIIAYDKGRKASEKVYIYDGRLYLFASFSDGFMNRIEHYDTTKNRLSDIFDILSFENGKYEMVKTRLGDTALTLSIQYSPGYDQPEDDPFLFLGTYSILLNTNPGAMQMEGPFTLKGKDRKMLSEGSFHKNARQGEWKFYFYDQNVLRLVQYNANGKTAEQYLELDSSKPYSGKFTLPTPEEGGYLLIKVKKGLRHGFTFKYDRQGNLVKKTKYKEGKKID